MCSVKKVFRKKFCEIHKENTCVKVYFSINLQASVFQSYRNQSIQQPLEVFCKKGYAQKFHRFCIQACNFTKKRLQRKCFPVKSDKFFRTPILKNTCERLLLSVCKVNQGKSGFYMIGDIHLKLIQQIYNPPST